MAPRFRNLKAREGIRAFERAGGRVTPGKGDHVNIKMPNGRIVTVPNKRTVGIGLLSDLIREAGITRSQFQRFLG